MFNNRRLSSRLIFLIPACLLIVAVQGQYYFDKLTEENGLSDNRITCFLKDKMGFLWVGTKNGLNRYDGNSFKIFKPGVGNSISNEVINDIVQEASGKIWVATMTGLNIYDPLSDRWETIMPDSGISKKGLPNYLIWDLSVDEQNQIWIASDVWQLSVIDPVTRAFRYYEWPAVWDQPQFKNYPAYKSIQRLERKSRNEWWLATTIGLFSVEIASGKFSFHGSGVAGNCKYLKYDKMHGKVFTVAETGQLFCYEEKNNVYREIKTSYQVYPSVAWNRTEEKQDLLLMPHPDGLLELNTATEKATVIRHQPSLSSTILPGGSNSVYRDGTSMTWIGTNNGVNFFSNQNSIADFLPLTIASDKDAVDGMGTAFYDKTDDRYYITSILSSELFIIDGRSGKISSIKSIGGKSLSACTNICLDLHNNIWLLTETAVYRYDRKNMTFEIFQTPNNSEKVIFTDLLEDKKGDYWFATWKDGAYHYKSQERKFYTYTIKDDFYSNTITALMNDPVDNAVWLASFNYGLFRYDLDSLHFTVNGEKTSNRNDYTQMNMIRDLETDNAGKLWISTYTAGLYYFTRGQSSQKSFSQLTVKNGLTHSGYYSLASDDRNRIWLLSGKGLSAIDRDGNFLYEVRNHPVINFTNYAPAASFPKRIFFNTQKHELLVPVAGGLIFYYPDKIIPATPFPVVLTDITIAGRSVINEPRYKQRAGINIPFKSNSISFRFAALKYIGREGLQFEYKLHVNDADWKTLGSSTTVNFPDMGSGNYTFLVRAKDASGTLSTNIASFSFHIIPPFWKTWWFFLLAAWLIAALIFLIYRYQLNKKLEVERLRLRISRDLHDDIGSALTSINVLSKVALSKGGDQAEVSGYLSRIKDSTMSTMESMSDIVWAINPKNDKLEALMSRMKEFAADICEAQGIDLDFGLPAELEKISLDLSRRKNLFLVFKEAINNAVKYSQCSLLTVKFERTGNKLQMTIHDNGKGFDRSSVIPGNGLFNMQERAEECGGSLHIESSVQSGTSLTLGIPLTRIGVSKKRETD